jgi:valyl-tRNA synthetase
MEISSKYDASLVEDKWYKHWMEKNYFHSEPDDREAFSIVIPPPNVTGILHMGHMLNNSIQDILIRKARIDGKNACWVPGTDHASIATEAKVVRMLREQGVKKSDLTRDEYLEKAWEWKEKYGGIILQQLKKLGASCDWERTAFTMDETRSEAVFKAFVDLHKKGKLYRGLRMVNWDPEAQTVLSNEEVLHKEENSFLYHVKYAIEGEENTYVTIATTRPETILGDSAIAVHPEDERYTHLKGKKVIVPLVNRAVPVIFDSYVEQEFGTGALKVTPAHDVNDYEIGKRHELEVIDIFNDNGTVSKAGELYIGLDRFRVRKEIVKDLEEIGLLAKKEDYPHSVGRSERTNAVVEPKLSMQWYVNMQMITEPALNAVMNDDVIFNPKKYKNTYKHWLDNIRDWCISRQLWWGHRIPAWYYEDEIFVAENAEQALEQAREKLNKPDLSIEDLKQDEDVLDTWFSSWLWPISVFDGFKNREELDYYYPTSVLVTGWDIIFLWVARMVMAGYEWEDKKPFDHVYFTGMVRDKQRRKMSKSLGNSPDALELINKFGADGVRFGMLSCSPAGGDLLFDDSLCDQGKKFCNKIWNALRFVKGWEAQDNIAPSDQEVYATEWFAHKLAAIHTEIEDNYKDFRLSEILKKLYSFIWDDFCSWYLEMIKPTDGKISKVTYDKTIEYFSQICTLLHPFMPFITEEVWHMLQERAEGEDCIMSQNPVFAAHDTDVLKDVEIIYDIAKNVRDIRNKNGVKQREELELSIFSSDGIERLSENKGWMGLVSKLAVLKSIEVVEKEVDNSLSFIIGTNKFFIELDQEIDVEAELVSLKEKLIYEEGFVASVNKKLDNERFVNNAPEAVVANEKKKLADGMDRIAKIKESIAKLS